jgi:NitT/TauT family transport system permease protein
LRARLPASLPPLFDGMKSAIPQAVAAASIAEFVGGDYGLGYLLLAASSKLDAPLVFASTALLVVGALGLHFAVGVLGRLALPWHAGARGSGRLAGDGSRE